MTLAQADDFRAECDALHELLGAADAAVWRRPTQFKAWTFDDVLGHLLMFDHAARLTVEDPEGFRSFLAGILAQLSSGASMRDCTRSWLGDCAGEALHARWRESAVALAELYAGLDPARRVAWAGPDMSVRSCISARQMETWAHGQALFDALGRTRVERDRLKNIAVMGVNTFAWTFANRGLDVPAVKPYVCLRSPEGSLWTWNEPSEVDRIEGDAVDFCRVVAQTRNVADTRLVVKGEAARAWLSIAQCFAGAPVDPPAPGTRFRVDPA